MKAVTEERLAKINVEFSEDSACCVIMASDGYPEKYAKGFEITIPDDIKDKVYIAGAAIKDKKLVTSGGRVLGAVDTAKSLEDAVKGAYSLVEKIYFENAYFRHDIGAKALLVKGGPHPGRRGSLPRPLPDGRKGRSAAGSWW